MTRTFRPLTGIPLEIWEATWVLQESAFTDILDAGTCDTEFSRYLTGGNAFTEF